MNGYKIENVLNSTVGFMVDYLNGLRDRPVFPTNEQLEALKRLDFDLPQQATEPDQVIELLHTVGSPGTVASAGGRYFGLCAAVGGGYDRGGKIELIPIIAKLFQIKIYAI